MGYTLPPPTGPSASASAALTASDLCARAEALIACQSGIEAVLRSQADILRSHLADIHSSIIDIQDILHDGLGDAALHAMSARMVELKNRWDRLEGLAKRVLEGMDAINTRLSELELHL